MFKWIARFFETKPPVETVFVSYTKANQMLLDKVGWRLSPKEDTNRVPGMVWLERTQKKV